MSNTSNQKRYPDNCRVFIGNLDNKAPGASKSNLTKIFEQYGTLVEEGNFKIFLIFKFIYIKDMHLHNMEIPKVL